MNPSHDWRVTQLTRLGIPGLLAEGAASHVRLARNRQAAPAGRLNYVPGRPV